MFNETFLKRNEFRTLYGERIYAIAKNIEKLYQKKVKIDEHIHFLKECKRNQLIPKGLRLKTTTFNTKNILLIQSTSIKLRNNLLDHRYREQRMFNIEIKTQNSIIKWYLEDCQPEREHNNDLHWMNKYDQLPKEKLRRTHERKLQDLMERQLRIYNNNNNNNNNNLQQQQPIDTSNVVNLSNINLSNKHLEILSKGLKFVPTPSSLNIIEVIANTENSLYSASTIIKRAAIAEISEFATKWKKPLTSNITKDERILLKEIKSNNNIIVVSADKGGKTVVMNKDMYISKIEDKLKDNKLYEETNDPTKKLKKKINNLAMKLFNKERISESQKLDFNSIDNLPTVRGQPKIHKVGNPIRIITCTRSTILSSISKFTFNLIKQLRETIDNNIMNTDEFISKINAIELEDDDHLMSLDVTELFNNVPINKTIDIVLQRIGQSEKFCQSNLTKSNIKQLLKLCLNNSFFTFNNKYYKQIKGLPMGNILSPLLADLYMHVFINDRLYEIKDRLYRYVDDLFVITKMSKNELESYVAHLNSGRSSIKLTCEYEKNGQLNFLDTTVSRNPIEKKLEVRWFRKETASDRLLHFNSSHHYSIKLNIIRTMVQRIINTTTNNEHQQQDLDILKQMLFKSSYPKQLVERTIQKCLQKSRNLLNSNDPDNQQRVETKFILSLPYVKGMEVLKRKLEKIGIKLYFGYPLKLKSLATSNIKPQSKSVVYQINCSCGKVYNGETKVGFENRMKQHETIIEEDKRDSSSEMVKHHFSTKWQCMFDPQEAVIIDNETNYWKRRKKEAIYSMINNSINKCDSIDNGWTNIIYKETKNKRKN